MKSDEVEAIFNLAGIPIVGMQQVANEYWPKHENYDNCRRDFPWWKVLTSYGVIRIGWRKRVIEIDWSKTDRRGLVTDYDTTKSDTMIHAWQMGDAVNYLKAFKSLPVISTNYPTLKEFSYTDPAKLLETMDMLLRLDEGAQSIEELALIEFVKQLGPKPNLPFKAAIERMTNPYNDKAPAAHRIIVNYGQLTIEACTFRTSYQT